MQIDLDRQEREVIVHYARAMMAVVKRDVAGGGRNVSGADAMTLAFWQRLVDKMGSKQQPEAKGWPA